MGYCPPIPGQATAQPPHHLSINDWLMPATCWEAQLQAKRAEVEQVCALFRLKQSRLDGLRVRAGTNGVLQEQTLKVGMWVTHRPEIPAAEQLPKS